MVDVDEAAQRLVFEGVDVAAIGAGDGTHAIGDGAQHRVEIQRGAELEPRLDQHGELPVVALQVGE